MKKILFLIFLFISTSIYSADLWIDLKTFEYGDTDATTIIYQYAIYNYSTFSVKVSDLAVQGYIYDAEGYTASGYAYDSYANQGSIYDSGNNWIATTTGTWQVSFYDETSGTCGTYDGIERKYKIRFVAKYTGTEEIPPNGGYMRLGGNNNYWFRIRHNDWTELSKVDDYSSTQAYSLSSDYLNPSQYKYLQIWDYRSIPILLCERINTNGDMDTESGEQPCGQSACTVPTDTFTPTSTFTEQYTPTFTPTFTPTNTPTEVVYLLYNNLGETYEDGYIEPGWDEYVIAVYDFENNCNDELGHYNGVSYAAGEIFWTDRSISGNYSFNNKANNYWIELPDSLWQYLASLNYYTIEYWAYNNVENGPTSWGATLGGTHPLTTAEPERFHWWLEANGDATLLLGVNSYWYYIDDNDLGNYKNNWAFYTYEYDRPNKILRLYVNGIKYIEATNQEDPFLYYTYGLDKLLIGKISTSNTDYMAMRYGDVYIDKLIFSSTLRNGQETHYFYGSEVIEDTGKVINKIRPIHNIYNK